MASPSQQFGPRDDNVRKTKSEKVEMSFDGQRMHVTRSVTLTESWEIDRKEPPAAELPAAEAHIDGMAATAATERGFGHSTPDPADADPVAGSHTNRGAPKPRAQLASAIAKLYSLLDSCRGHAAAL